MKLLTRFTRALEKVVTSNTLVFVVWIAFMTVVACLPIVALASPNMTNVYDSWVYVVMGVVYTMSYPWDVRRYYLVYKERKLQ